LPVEKFYNAATGTKVKNNPDLPYATIDIIFNNKNIWSNMQYQDPAYIYYHLHTDTQWLPLVRNPIYPHYHNQEEMKRFKHWLKKFCGEESTYPREIDIKL